MFFKRKNIEFSNQLPFNQLESVLKKHIQPKLLELGFKMLVDKEFNYILFSRNFDQFEHIIQFKLLNESKTNGKVIFRIEWFVVSDFYCEWHLKKYGDYCLTNELASWTDSSCPEIDKKYCKVKHNGFSVEYDLACVSTEKLMSHILKQTIDIRVPMLKYYSNWRNLGDWNSKELAHLGIAKIFDCYILANDIKKAGSVLKQAEDYLKMNTEEFEYRTKVIEKRKTLLKKIIQNQ